jgi:hypothetical protein
MLPLSIPSLLLNSLLVAALFGGDDIPQRTDKSLSAVLNSVAKAGYESITEVSYDDGQWEVEALKNNEPVGLRIDPQSGKVLREHRDEPHPRLPAKLQALPALVGRLEKDGYHPIKKAEFHVTGWEIEALHDGSWRELILDTQGKIVDDQPDR